MSLLDRILNMIATSAPRALPILPPPEFAGAHVTYQPQGGCGHVVFAHRSTRFSLYYEFAGGEAIAVIRVPTDREWTTHTGLPANTREPLLRFIGATVAYDQTSDHAGRYELTADAITIYARR